MFRDGRCPVFPGCDGTAGKYPETGEKRMVNVSAEGQVFKCEICGNVVIVKEAGGGELICCGEPMVLESE